MNLYVLIGTFVLGIAIGRATADFKPFVQEDGMNSSVGFKRPAYRMNSPAR